MEIITIKPLIKHNFPCINIHLIYGTSTKLYSIIIDNLKHPLNPCIIKIDEPFYQKNHLDALIEFNRIFRMYSYDDIYAKIHIFNHIETCYSIISELHLSHNTIPYLNFKLIYDITKQRYFIFLGNYNQIIHLYPSFYNNDILNAIKYFKDIVISKNILNQIQELCF